MAGCSVVIMCFIILPIIGICLVLFLGAAVGSMITALLSTAALVILKNKGFFAKYKTSEKALYRYGSVVLHVLLIVLCVCSWLVTVGIAAAALYIKLA